MTIRQLVSKIAPDVLICILKEGCTDLASFRQMTGYEAQKEFITSNTEVKDFRINKSMIYITI